MRYLFVHQAMPGQFPHLAKRLAEDPKNEVYFLTHHKARPLPGVKMVRYRIQNRTRGGTHPFLQNLQNGVHHGEALARSLLWLQKEQHFRPDLIYAHPGWGETLFAKEILPDVPLIHYCEFFYHALGADCFFGPDEVPELKDQMKIRTKNAVNYLSLDLCDRAITPMQWQLRKHPPQYHDKISVIHDGIDTTVLKPDAGAQFELPDGQVLRPGGETVTYVNRSMEPCRGLSTFIDGALMVAKERPNCQFVIVGHEGINYYGPRPPSGTTYTEIEKAKLGEFEDRFHFVGMLPYQRYMNLLRVSAAHVYLTRPFVLSWSMLEAMATGCLVVGSMTPPVAEVIEDERNGLLFDYFSPDEMAERIIEALSDPERAAEIRREARQTVIERYELQDCLRRQLSLIDTVLNGASEPCFAT